VRTTSLCLGLALLAAAGCGRPSPPPAAGRLEVRAARAVLTRDAGAVYFTVVNPGPQSDRLLRVETAAARAAEPHESVMENGVMRMVERPEGFEIPAGGTLELAPGGKHVMLIAPTMPAGAGGTLPLTLHFAHAGTVEVSAALSPVGGKTE
jgi:copper(I)-binding protein